MTNRPPTLSVIVPCYNIESYVPETVTSLVNNERDDFEFIFVEDRSTKDKTYEALLTLTKRLKNSRVIRHEQNGGLATARNTGIDASEGRYLTFLDGDDWLAPGYLADLVDAIEWFDVDFVRTDHVQVTGIERTVHRAPEGRRHTPLDPRTSILPVDDTTMVDYPYAWAGVYHRRLLDQGMLRFHDGLKTAEDRPWIWDLHRRAESYAVASLRGVFYRRGVASSLTQIGDVRQLDFFRSFDLVLAELAGDPEVGRLRKKALRNYCVVIAHQLLSRGRFERSIAAKLKQMAAEALGRMSEDELEEALVGMGEERVYMLRRIRGGMKGVAA
ncbi:MULTISPECIES: glycosyltransferase family 2 protein [unclassified Streptomyces]|uniref:glycosyltransferase family 2 protein n=1 Tax=unclassified Streptomyces TaxID=2593676 RepID=UPI0023658EA0|nr:MULTISPECIES: glycosyltransferase family 2 protein [unclassified Streptomyces]MDF3144399.1 glycosyltransferase family 2 protein [Streptomyces sp. T21Q-yed]WDF40773.1 glycosyltransferase family 2 protein [Streptomyces sp. T12]